MKILLLSFFIMFSSPLYAAESSALNPNTPKTETPRKQETDKSANTEIKKEEKTVPNAESEKQDVSDYSCKYYSVTLPKDWKAILPPTEQQGSINAIFAQKSGSPIITMVVGQTGGADAGMIANMFAEQFKAPKPPVQKNGQYTFNYPTQDTIAKAYVTSTGNEFMFTYILGNLKEAMNFISKNIKSEEYSSLLPK